MLEHESTEHQVDGKPVDHEHRELLTCLAELLRDATPPAGFPEQLPWRRRMGGRLHTFVRLLAAHFAHEEMPGGFYDALRENTPHETGELDDLVEEHGLLFRWAEGIAHSFHEGRVPASDLGRELRGFINGLHQHERREARLHRSLP